MSGPPADLWAAFAGPAAVNPDAPALIFPDDVVSRGELLAQARAASGFLAENGVGRGDVVALRLPKRRETYALWLACLARRAPYVFVDPRNPPSRTAQMLDRLRPKLLVSAGETGGHSGSTLRLDTVGDGDRWLADISASARPIPAPLPGHDRDPAYIMFTSGSTGEPKGAVIPQCGVLGLMGWARSLVSDPSAERFSNINPLHFDNAVFDLYGGLLNGAALVPVETAEVTNPAGWVRRLREGAGTVLFAVPTLFLTLDQLGLLKPERLPDARLFIFGGEGFPIAPLRAVHERFAGRARLVNVYGPTETSCICSSLEIGLPELAAAGDGLPSLGRMHPDFDYAILDADAGAVPVNAPGELWIGGPRVGLGYYANADETTARFRQDPRQDRFRSIWYRSGDFVREDDEGLLWFHGRVDNQIKLRGHRIELEEVDIAVESLAAIRRAVCISATSPDGLELRVAYVADQPVSEQALRDHCAERLPPYMRPSRFLQVEKLPQNANGKVDRKATAALIEGEAER